MLMMAAGLELSAPAPGDIRSSGHLQPPAATCGHLRPPAATCTGCIALATTAMAVGLELNPGLACGGRN